MAERSLDSRRIGSLNTQPDLRLAPDSRSGEGDSSAVTPGVEVVQGLFNRLSGLEERIASFPGESLQSSVNRFVWNDYSVHIVASQLKLSPEATVGVLSRVQQGIPPLNHIDDLKRVEEKYKQDIGAILFTFEQERLSYREAGRRLGVGYHIVVDWRRILGLPIHSEADGAARGYINSTANINHQNVKKRRDIRRRMEELRREQMSGVDSRS